MAGAAGPNTAEAGLVFAYDLGNTTTSYIGEPTTNVIDAVNFTSNISSWNAQENVTITRNQVNPLGVVDNTCIKIHPNSASDNYMGVRGVKFADANANHTFSFWARGNKSYSSFPINFGVIQLTVYVNITTDWQYFTVQTGVNKNFTEHTVHFGGWGTWTDTSFDLFLWRPQIEQKSHATPFVNGTRSATQGLLNLTGNGTINITNASFDNNAQLVFDGTNDLIFTADSTYLNPGSSPFSIELLFNCSNASVGEGILYNKENLYEAAIHGGVFQYAWQPHWNWDGDSTFPVSSNTWYHAVVTYDGSYQRMYKNGVEVYNRAQSGNMGTNSVVLSMGARGVDGSGGSGYNFFPGQIPVVKAYKAALTAAEVQQNYQALRYRFGI